MDVNVYFDAMYFELNFLKAKINDIIAAIEKAPSPAREKVAPQLPRLRYVARHLTKRIELLFSEYPANWTAAMGEMERHQPRSEGPFTAVYGEAMVTEFPREFHPGL